MKVQEDITYTWRVYSANSGSRSPAFYNTMIYYPKLKSKCFHHCWETWHHLTSSQLSSWVSAGLMFKWRGYGMRIGNQKFFRPWSANLLVSVGQTTSQRINYFYANETISISEHKAPTY